MLRAPRVLLVLPCCSGRLRPLLFYLNLSISGPFSGLWGSKSPPRHGFVRWVTCGWFCFIDGRRQSIPGHVLLVHSLDDHTQHWQYKVSEPDNMLIGAISQVPRGE